MLFNNSKSPPPIPPKPKKDSIAINQEQSDSKIRTTELKLKIKKSKKVSFSEEESTIIDDDQQYLEQVEVIDEILKPPKENYINLKEFRQTERIQPKPVVPKKLNSTTFYNQNLNKKQILEESGDHHNINNYVIPELPPRASHKKQGTASSLPKSTTGHNAQSQRMKQSNPKNYVVENVIPVEMLNEYEEEQSVEQIDRSIGRLITEFNNKLCISKSDNAKPLVKKLDFEKLGFRTNTSHDAQSSIVKEPNQPNSDLEISDEFEGEGEGIKQVYVIPNLPLRGFNRKVGDQSISTNEKIYTQKNTSQNEPLDSGQSKCTTKRIPRPPRVQQKWEALDESEKVDDIKHLHIIPNLPPRKFNIKLRNPSVDTNEQNYPLGSKRSKKSTVKHLSRPPIIQEQNSTISDFEKNLDRDEHSIKQNLISHKPHLKLHTKPMDSNEKINMWRKTIQNQSVDSTRSQRTAKRILLPPIVKDIASTNCDLATTSESEDEQDVQRLDAIPPQLLLHRLKTKRTTVCVPPGSLVKKSNSDFGDSSESEDEANIQQPVAVNKNIHLVKKSSQNIRPDYRSSQRTKPRISSGSEPNSDVYNTSSAEDSETSENVPQSNKDVVPNLPPRGLRTKFNDQSMGLSKKFYLGNSKRTTVRTPLQTSVAELHPTNSDFEDASLLEDPENFADQQTTKPLDIVPSLPPRESKFNTALRRVGSILKGNKTTENLNNPPQPKLRNCETTEDAKTQTTIPLPNKQTQLTRNVNGPLPSTPSQISSEPINSAVPNINNKTCSTLLVIAKDLLAYEEKYMENILTGIKIANDFRDSLISDNTIDKFFGFFEEIYCLHEELFNEIKTQSRSPKKLSLCFINHISKFDVYIKRQWLVPNIENLEEFEKYLLNSQQLECYLNITQENIEEYLKKFEYLESKCDKTNGLNEVKIVHNTLKDFAYQLEMVEKFKNINDAENKLRDCGKVYLSNTFKVSVNHQKRKPYLVCFCEKKIIFLSEKNRNYEYFDNVLTSACYCNEINKNQVIFEIKLSGGSKRFILKADSVGTKELWCKRMKEVLREDQFEN